MKSFSETNRLVVTDAGPLIALSKSGYLHLLPALFSSVIIPASVKEELRMDDDRPGSSTLRAAILHDAVYSIATAKSVPAALVDLLDPGEAEAIALAEEKKCLLLIDERKGRSVARKRGIPIVGTGRILIAAKKHGHIKSIAEALEKLRQNGYRLADALCKEILRLAGETNPR